MTIFYSIVFILSLLVGLIAAITLITIFYKIKKLYICVDGVKFKAVNIPYRFWIIDYSISIHICLHGKYDFIHNIGDTLNKCYKYYDIKMVNDEYVYEVNNMIHNLNTNLRRSTYIYYRIHETK